MKNLFLLPILFLAVSCNWSNKTRETSILTPIEGSAEATELTLDKIRITQGTV